MTILFRWRLLIILRKLFLSTFFLFAVHLHSNEAQFEVLVNFSVPVSITLNTGNLSRTFTRSEAQSLANNSQNASIGSFVITVSSSTNINFTVFTHASAQYVAGNSRFQARSSNDENTPCLLLFTSNKTDTGADVPTELINFSTLITHSGSDPQSVISRTISVQMDGGQIESIENSNCTMSLLFTVEGA